MLGTLSFVRVQLAGSNSQIPPSLKVAQTKLCSQVETTLYQVERRPRRIATGRAYLHLRDDETRMRGARSGQGQGVASDHLEGNQVTAYDHTGGLADMATRSKLVVVVVSEDC